MRVIHIASEIAPLAKVGGLGEVLSGLVREQRKLYREVAVFLPFYDLIDRKRLSSLKKVDTFTAHKNSYAVWEAEFEDFFLFLLEELSSENPLQRGAIYQGPGDIERFVKFCLGAHAFLQRQKKSIEILHLHDWHTTLMAPLFSRAFKTVEILLTLHSVGYQGRTSLEKLEGLGVGRDLFLQKGLVSEKGEVNLLQVGIEYADRVIAVSPSYAKEILTSAFGFGLSSVFQKHRSKLFGILNGLDLKVWDPEIDPYLPKKFGKKNAFPSIEKGKEAAKEALLKIFGKNKALPWVGVISRLVAQKGPEFIPLAIEETLKAGGSFFLLGSSPSADLKPLFDKLQAEFASHPNVCLHFQFDEKIAHLLYAALDFFWMPSLYEPCGLSQMIAMRYGAVPITSKTGGLKDTVFDGENHKIPLNQRNGFLFEAGSLSAGRKKLQEALSLYRENRALYQKLVQNGMQANFSWQKPAKEYDKLYRESSKKKKESDIVA